jgi:hypothetical protein
MYLCFPCTIISEEGIIVFWLFSFGELMTVMGVGIIKERAGINNAHYSCTNCIYN